jgi:hypothetical protein
MTAFWYIAPRNLLKQTDVSEVHTACIIMLINKSCSKNHVETRESVGPTEMSQCCQILLHTQISQRGFIQQKT